MKKAFFPLISLIFVIACAVFVYLAREAETVYVNVIPAVVENADTGVPGASRPTSTPIEPAKTSLVNINTASLDELMTLQGIGPAIGQRIIDYREESGLFMTIHELKEVSGIGEVMFERIRELITV
ncbi:MAG: ComEA family DNA-binding protein [Oscillospiraceae bacterium]|nr:ComEA family DNA-binding protein [Oscillospiraceae bacterium]